MATKLKDAPPDGFVDGPPDGFASGPPDGLTEGPPDGLQARETSGVLLHNDPSKSAINTLGKTDLPLEGDVLTQAINVPMIPGFAAVAGAGLAVKAAKPLAKAAGELGSKMISGETSLLIREIANKSITEGSKYATAAGEYFAKYGEYPAAAEAAVKEAAKRGEAWAMDLVKSVGEKVGLKTAQDAESKVLLGGENVPIQPLAAPSKITTLPGLRPHKFATDAERAMAEEVISRMPADRIAQAGGQPQSWAVTEAKAAQTGWTKDTILNLPLDGTRPYTPAEQVRIGQVFTNENQRLILLKSAFEKAKQTAPDDAVTKALESTYAQQFGDTMKIGIIRAGVVSTEGRALNAAKIALKGVNDQTVRMAKALSGATPEVRELVMKQLMTIPPENLTPEKYVELLQKLDRWSVRRMFVEWATTAKLMSPHTDIINVGTEALNIAWDVPVKALAGVLDKVGDPILTKIYGEGRARFAGEVLADVKGMASGVRIGGYKALQALLHPDRVSEMLEGRGGQAIAIKGRPGMDTWVDKLLDVTGKGMRLAYAKLGIEDIFLKSIAEQGQIRAFTYRKVMQEGKFRPGTPEFLKRESFLLQNPTLDLLEAANTQADIMIFRQESGLPIKLLHQALDAVPEGRLIVPFIKIGPNIVRESLKKGPGTVLLPASWKALRNERGPAMDVIANAVLGTAAMAPFVHHASKGGITLEAPEERYAKDKFYADGHQPNAINIAGYDVPVSRVAPFGEFITTAARVWKMIDNKDMDRVDVLLANFAASQVKNYTDKTFLQGMNDTLQAMVNGERYGMKFLQNLATSSTIPAPVGLVARAIDPTFRKAKGIPEAFAAKIPGASDDLLPQRGLFGEERQRPGSTAARLLSPIVPSKVQEEPVRKFLKDNNLKAYFPPDTVNGRTLSPEEQDFVSAYAGPLMKKYLIDNQKFLHGLAVEGKLKEAQSNIDAEHTRNLGPVTALLTLPSELRALKLEIGSLSKPTKDALENYILNDALYKASKDDDFKRRVLQAIIDAGSPRRQP